MHFHAPSVEATLALGRRLGELAPLPPLVTCIALDGPLGAGKTHLTRGIALGAGVRDVSLVSSPTYVLMNIYEGPKPVYHLDAYRVESPDAFAELGLEEILRGDSHGDGGIVVVEWAQRIAALLPEDTLWMTLSHAGETQRTIDLSAGGGRSQELLRLLRVGANGDGSPTA